MNEEHLYKILLAPIVSEKSMAVGELGHSVFKVAKNATKTEIKASVEKMFSVKVDAVKTLVVKGKTKRTRYGIGKRSDWKKAYVKLAEGHEIDYAMGG